MAKLDPVYEALARRARTVSAFGWFGKALVAAGALALGLSATAAAASWSFPGMPVAVGAIAFSAGISGYFFGRSRPVNMTRSLFRADAGLGTEARLSTLHAIRDTQDLQPFALRIAAGLPSRPLVARVALPFTRRQVALVVGGALLVVASLVLAAVLPAHRTGLPRGPEPLVAGEGRLESRAAEPAEAVTQRATVEGDGSDSLLQAPATSASGSSSPSSEEAARGVADVPTRPRGVATLEETLAEIERRMSSENAGLTQSDVEALQAFAEASEGPLATAIRDLLSAPTREEALSEVRAMLADPGTRDADRIRADDGSGPPSGELRGVATGPVPADASAPSRAVASPALSDAPSNTGGVFPFFDDELSGASTIELIGATLPSSIGDAGEYSYYITKSVPVEPPAGVPTLAGAPRSLSFERASTIAAGRALPSDVLDAVRDYFTQITEGGS